MIIIRGIFSGIISLMVARKVFTTYDWEIGTESEESTGSGYSPFISGHVLPTLLLTFAGCSLIYCGFENTLHTILNTCFGIFLHIGLYYMLLISMLPFLRKHITARACALLWMIPNYLYFTLQGGMVIEEPLLVLRAPQKVVWTLFYIWLAGFVLVMLWQITSHLRYRLRVLATAQGVTDPDILALWKEELIRVGIFSKQLKLVISSETTTPLSIGLFRFTTRVVLPQRNYDMEELTLILRHEITHISREDAWSKFFLIFCTAMCWFNPFMWISRRKCAEDLELSCDETVLLKEDDATRRKYATLILSTAGDERGFTTCLSASATALRYRLSNIMKPKKQASGAIVTAIVTFLLFMSCGYVGLAYDGTTGGDAIPAFQNTEEYLLKTITLYTNPNSIAVEENSSISLQCSDPSTLHDYLSELQLETITGNFYGTSKGKQLNITYTHPNKGLIHIILSDKFLKIKGQHLKYLETSYYYLPKGLDWEYLSTLLHEKTNH